MAEATNTLPGEEWKPVKGWEEYYQVSNFGRVLRLAREVSVLSRWGSASLRRLPEMIMKQTKNRGRYWQVCLKHDGRVANTYVHRLVCEAFHGASTVDCPQVAHFDGDGFNNNAENLRWSSVRDNNADKIRHGTSRRGEKHPTSRISLRAVKWIRSLPDNRFDRRIAARLGMKPSSIKLIRLGHSWKWIDSV